jgi:hypothetical protein
MSDAVHGSCLCGGVRFEVRMPAMWFQYCHCSRCRKKTGSAHSAHLLVKPEQVAWHAGADLVGRFELPDAKAYSSCWCTRCGSALPWTTRNGRWVVVPAGVLDDDPGIVPERSIYVGSAAPWYRHPAEIPSFEEVPPRE